MKRDRNIRNLEQDLITNEHVFEGVENLKYLGALINSRNLIRDEIKSRIAASNGYLYGVRHIIRSRAVSKAVKIKVYKTMVQPVVVYGSETWAKNEMGMKRLDTGGGKY
jgi:hypothetical protein